MTAKLSSIQGKRVETAKESAVEIYDAAVEDIDVTESPPICVVAITVHADGSFGLHAAGSAMQCVGALEAAKLQLLLDDE